MATIGASWSGSGDAWWIAIESLAYWISALLSDKVRLSSACWITTFLEWAVSLNSSSVSAYLSFLRACEKVYPLWLFECGIMFSAIIVGLTSASSSLKDSSLPGSENLIAWVDASKHAIAKFYFIILFNLLNYSN